MKIKSVAIEVTDKAFLPEAYAYRDFFVQNGLDCNFVSKGDPHLLDYDCVLLFHGFHPFWKRYPKFVIGEYHSLSTGRLNRVKDLIKRALNVRSDLYVFLNEEVRRGLWFSNNINYITRAMGYSKKDFDRFRNEKKKFDLVYCGSYREGLSEVLIRLAGLGMKIAVVGPDIDFQNELITSFGRVDPSEARRIISQATHGLNYTPDVFPLNIQDSTKVIEYCAAGLGVITNRYSWVNNFELVQGARFLTLDDVRSIKDVETFDFCVPDVSDLEWDSIIGRSGLLSKLGLR